MKSIEKKVADAILQRASVSIEIEGKVYPVAPATPATLILVSDLVTELPEVRTDADNLLFETLRTARDCSVIGDIVAALILGAKRIKEQHTISVERTTETRRFSWKKLRWVKVREKHTEDVLEFRYLSELILDNCSPATISEIVSKRLLDMGLSDFFGLTTSLSAANLIRPTREVG